MRGYCLPTGMDYIVDMKHKVMNFRLSVCLAALLALAGCNVTTSTELHHEDALSVFEYAATDSDAYVEVVGNPTGGSKEAVTAPILEKFDSNWGHLRTRFKAGLPPRETPYKVRVIFDVPQHWDSHSLCTQPADQFPASSVERLHMMVLSCGDGPLSEIRGSLKRPTSLNDPVLQKTLNFLISQFVVEPPQRGNDCNVTSTC